MEIFACLLVLLFIKLIEWTWKFFIAICKLCGFLIMLPFKGLNMFINEKANKSRKVQNSRREYHDPVEKMEDHWDNHPEELDLEDIFWLDELTGDD